MPGGEQMRDRYDWPSDGDTAAQPTMPRTTRPMTGDWDSSGDVWDAELVDEPWDPAAARSAEDVEVIDATALDAIANTLADVPGQPGPTRDPFEPARPYTPQARAGVAGAFHRTASTAAPVDVTPAAAGAGDAPVAETAPAGQGDPGAAAVAAPPGQRHRRRAGAAAHRPPRAAGGFSLDLPARLAAGWEATRPRLDALLRRRVGPVPVVAIGAIIVVLAVLVSALVAEGGGHGPAGSARADGAGATPSAADPGLAAATPAGLTTPFVWSVQTPASDAPTMDAVSATSLPATPASSGSVATTPGGPPSRAATASAPPAAAAPTASASPTCSPAFPLWRAMLRVMFGVKSC
jgi:hypothetical protein